LPIDEFSDDESEADPVLQQIQESQPNNEFIIKSEKAYFLKEQKDSSKRNVKLVPLVSVEKSFDMETKISDCINQKFQHDIREGETVVSKNFGYFSNYYRNESYNILDTVKSSPEYKLLFKYLFPIDRMLSISNIYSSTFLASMKDIDKIFDLTKERLKRLFFIIGKVGQYDAECTTSNKDLMDAILNGLPIAGMGAQMALMIAKTILLIFKGFMEVADPNIQVSKRLIDIIHLANKAIAQAQIMANSASAMGSAIGDIFQDCEDKKLEAKQRLNEDAKDMYEWLKEMKMLRYQDVKDREEYESDGSLTQDARRALNQSFRKKSQSELLRQVGVDENKRSAFMRLENWFDAEYPDTITTSERGLVIKPAQKKSIFVQAKELNPDADTLKEIAEQDCSEDDCPPGARPPGMPPKDLFDPIDENFIPEPKIWQIGLALLPWTLIPFAPGIPLTLPFGLAYWVLDEKPMPDWLNSVPPADWLDKLFSEAADEEIKSVLGTGTPQDPETCVADLGLPPPGTYDDDI
jgi:hypothetical protein